MTRILANDLERIVAVKHRGTLWHRTNNPETKRSTKLTRGVRAKGHHVSFWMETPEYAALNEISDKQRVARSILIREAVRLYISMARAEGLLQQTVKTRVKT